ncbi:MAG: ABC transporter permease [Cellulomonas sp.]|nr:ABC transporter permease [Cellulomonas sp.]
MSAPAAVSATSPSPSPSAATSTRTRGAAPRRRRAWSLGDAIVPVFATLAFAYLLVPIAYTVAFSFNDAGRSNLVWRGFSLDAWRNPCGAPQVCESLVNSLLVGLIATVVATVLGTLIAIALVRYRFRGRTAANLLIFLPMSTPEVVLGAALLAQFLAVRVQPGFGTVVIAHIMFCISFVVVTVKARVASLDPKLEEAAADLYASSWLAFWKVTFPLLIPGIAAAALLAFSLSFDDFIITNFNSGSFTTFPKFVYVSATRGIPPQANVIGSMMFFLALALVLAVQVLAAVKRRRAATVS